MDLTVILTGMLPFIVLVSAALTAIASLLLLRLYRRAVIRAMGTGSGTASPPPPPRSQRPPDTGQELGIVTVTSRDSVGDEAQAAFDATSASLRRLALVYVLAGLAYAVILALPWMITAGGGFPPTRFLWLLVCYGWPIVLTLLLVAATTRRQRAWITGLYFSAAICVAALALLRNAALDAGQLAYFWLFANGPATLLLAAFLARRIRAVGPLVLAFMVVGVTGSALTVVLAGSDETLLRSIADAGGALGLGAREIFILLQLAGFTVFGLIGWRLLGRLGRAYRAKRMSDQSLTADALWLQFGVLQSITLAFEGWAWILTGLIAFAAYRLICATGFARMAVRRPDDGHSGPSLLLLRVFALGRRSEQLLDGFSKRWLRAGSMDLIAGPDLATSTVEPHEFLEFVGGRLSRQFIDDTADLQRRLAERDTRPDPDGRHRVNEFFCRQDTWQMAVQSLASGSDAVLMDLRSFSPANQGCSWELEQLVVRVPLERVVFIIDETTDRSFLESKARELWQRIPPDSINRSRPGATLRLFEAPSATRSSDALVRMSLAACASVSAR